MIIHSITPVEFLIPPQAEATDEIRPFAGGYLSGRMTGGGFQISRVISTDPGVYLNKSMAPGQILKQDSMRE